MNSEPKRLLLADDDDDDCLFFSEALSELPFSTLLKTVHDGEQLMTFLLRGNEPLPDVLFLDLNIPRKNGLECLMEIKLHDKLKHLLVIIVSTSSEQAVVNKLYDNGAHYYIQKPSDFSHLKRLIYQALSLTTKMELKRTSRDEFVLFGVDEIKNKNEVKNRPA